MKWPTLRQRFDESRANKDNAIVAVLFLLSKLRSQTLLHCVYCV